MSAATTITSMEEVFAAYAEYRDSHAKALYILFSSMAILSVISSSILIRMILRSSSGLTTTFHRILLGMAVGDILYSLGYVSFGAMMPRDVSYIVWNARGNQTTCNVEGFLATVGWSLTLLYSCSLNLHALSLVKYRARDHTVRTKIEPFLHGVPIAFALALGVFYLATRGYNSDLLLSCASPTYKAPHCVGYEDGQVREGFEIPCGRGSDGPAPVVSKVMFFLLTVGVPITVVVTLVVMVRDLSQQERRIAKYGVGALNQGTVVQQNTGSVAADGEDSDLGGKVNSVVSSAKGKFRRLTQRPGPNHNNSNSRRVMHRALAYSISYFLTWIWYIIIVIIHATGVPVPQIPIALVYLMAIFQPLQGLYNLMIFLQPKVVHAKSQGRGISWSQAFAKASGFSTHVESNMSKNDVPPASGLETRE